MEFPDPNARAARSLFELLPIRYKYLCQCKKDFSQN